MFGVFQEDCLKILKTMSSNVVDLIYLDPPFYTGRIQTQKTRDNSYEYKFIDRWENLEAYIEFLKPRITECKRVLKKTGSIFLHCDKNASHHLRVLMDDIFGEENFVNEIIWSYKRWSNSKKGLMNAHQNIFFYSKTKDFKFFPEFTDYSPTTNIDQILQARDRNIHNKSAYKRDGNGDIVLGKEKIGVPLSDIWEIPFLNPKAKERVGYPTQKPIILVERIINLTTQENDTILDPFCGSGTTIVAAALNNRNYIGIDISKEAIELTRQRLSDRKKTISALLKKGASAYLNKDDYIRQILYQLDAVVVERNKGIDGFLKKHYNNKPVAVYVQRKNQTIQEALELVKMATRSKKVEKIILVRTNDRATLFDDKLYEFNKDIISIESLDFQLITKFNSLPISA